MVLDTKSLGGCRGFASNIGGWLPSRVRRAATAVVLGALSDDEFEIEEQRLELSPDDVIVAYTDGTFEARDRAGRQLGLDRLRRLVQRQPPPDNWPRFICSCVEQHKVGRAEDDVLITALTFAAFRPQPQTARPALARS